MIWLSHVESCVFAVANQGRSPIQFYFSTIYVICWIMYMLQGSPYRILINQVCYWTSSRWYWMCMGWILPCHTFSAFYCSMPSFKLTESRLSIKLDFWLKKRVYEMAFSVMVSPTHGIISSIASSVHFLKCNRNISI
jgi:hypothetical protein